MTDSPSSPAPGAGFADHFSGHAAAYAQHRPRYPDALFAALAALAPGRRRVWDCATGNGQAAVALAEHFDAVEATDASAEQVARGVAHARVAYRVAPAETSGLADASVDLITVAQAFHWFDHARFHAEAERVLVPGGIVAVWCYALAHITPEIDAVIHRMYEHTRPWWPAERAHLEAGYAGLPWPWPALEASDLERAGDPERAAALRALGGIGMTASWGVEALLGYLGTWSGVQRYIKALGRDPVAELAPELRRLWGPEVRRVTWPLALLVARKAGER